MGIGDKVSFGIQRAGMEGLKCLLAFLCFLPAYGCGAGRYEAGPVYLGPGPGRGAIEDVKGVTLYVAPVAGSEDRLWYEAGSRRWFLERSPALLVREALVQSLEAMGISTTQSPACADARLDARIRWFAPYGHSPFTAAVIVSVSLAGGEGDQVLWRGRIRAGRANGASKTSGVYGGRAKIEKTVSEVLTEAVNQLRWKPGFIRLKSILPLEKPSACHRGP